MERRGAGPAAGRLIGMTEFSSVRKLIVLTFACLGWAVVDVPAQGAGASSRSFTAAAPRPAGAHATPLATASPVAPTTLFPESCPERLYDFLQDAKKEHHLPVGAGAWHWEHLNTGGPNRSGYGIPPDLSGTYFWYFTVDPEFQVDAGPVSKIGGHTELRFREQDQFRPYFDSQFWSYETYLWADTEVGRFKAGQIVKRFGLAGAGDGSFWGTVPFWDGFNLNPSFGAAWDNSWKVRDDFSIDTSLQFFVADDGVAGAAVGGSPESAPGAHEFATGVVRAVPTWVLADKSTFALGFSASVGGVEHIKPDGRGDTLVAWEIDATYSWKNFKLFGEVLQSYGVLNPTRYVSGGPSSRVTDLIAGVQCVSGPVTFRFTYSAGFDHNPSGWQHLWVPGITVALTKNIDFYADYVRWDAYRASNQQHTVFENGVQLVINWRL